ncbi:hypothetical protein B0T20DRAFT_396023 [Sordaria brevicollis]|uniref:Uncharacterized protein n=1 Tax=Sordaria brevicollis TaxID=83679 RepID=A0AAE0P3M4_SORBR|nr:hypothetical protein B0T20DRAFT_396023 [Sordaria brevicollis]
MSRALLVVFGVQVFASFVSSACYGQRRRCIYLNKETSPRFGSRGRCFEGFHQTFELVSLANRQIVSTKSTPTREMRSGLVWSDLISPPSVAVRCGPGPGRLPGRFKTEAASGEGMKMYFDYAVVNSGTELKVLEVKSRLSPQPRTLVRRRNREEKVEMKCLSPEALSPGAMVLEKRRSQAQELQGNSKLCWYSIVAPESRSHSQDSQGRSQTFTGFFPVELSGLVSRLVVQDDRSCCSSLSSQQKRSVTEDAAARAEPKTDPQWVRIVVLWGWRYSERRYATACTPQNSKQCSGVGSRRRFVLDVGRMLSCVPPRRSCSKRRPQMNVKASTESKARGSASGGNLPDAMRWMSAMRGAAWCCLVLVARGSISTTCGHGMVMTPPCGSQQSPES